MEIARRPPLRIPRVLAYGTSWPTSWTTVYTVPNRTTTELSVLCGVATVTETKNLDVRLVAPDGTQVQISRDGITTAGDEVSVLYLRDGQTIPLEQGWQLQLLASGSNSATYFVAGYEHHAPN